VGRQKNITNELRASIIHALESGVCSRKSAAATFQVPYPTVVRIYAKFLKEGVTAKKTQGGRKPRKLCEEEVQSIREWLDEDCTLTLAELQVKLRTARRISISLTTIRTYILEFNYTLKRVQTIAAASANPERDAERRVYSEWFLRMTNSGRIIVYFDETGFQVSMRRYYGRAPAGQRALRVVPAIKTTNRTVMAAMSRDGLIHYKALEGPGNRVRLLQYLDELFTIFEAREMTRVILVMDNAVFHRCAEIRAAIEGKGHELAFLPAYSPFFNPIENMFSQWKSLVRGGSPGNEAELMGMVGSFMGIVTREHCQNYCQHAISNAIDCLAGQLVYDQ
jgi:transposase